jgi:metallophosphoesterase (TIGR00282 family)
MKCIFIGDIVGNPGIIALKEALPVLVSRYEPDITIANGENAANGFGITRKIAHDFIEAGVDVITSGNHIWDRKGIIKFIDKEERLLRPANFPAGVPGTGSRVFCTASAEKVGILNLSGRVFMQPIECPFKIGLQEVEELMKYTKIIVVDMHAEATSEKISMGWVLDGKVSAVIGSHTHVQTADEKILPKGTAYITDVGMTGSFDSVIGMKNDSSIKRFLTQMPYSFEVANNDKELNCVSIEIDTKTGKALNIERIQLKIDT